jgi:hypothetical protein
MKPRNVDTLFAMLIVLSCLVAGAFMACADLRSNLESSP